MANELKGVGTGEKVLVSWLMLANTKRFFSVIASLLTESLWIQYSELSFYVSAGSNPSSFYSYGFSIIGKRGRWIKKLYTELFSG
jgi:hypothetical protein